MRITRYLEFTQFLVADLSKYSKIFADFSNLPILAQPLTLDPPIRGENSPGLTISQFVNVASGDETHFYINICQVFMIIVKKDLKYLYKY